LSLPEAEREPPHSSSSQRLNIPPLAAGNYWQMHETCFQKLRNNNQKNIIPPYNNPE
jgi:hypothetical protein